MDQDTRKMIDERIVALKKTIQDIHAQREAMLKQSENLLAQMIANQGAVAILEDLLKDLPKDGTDQPKD